ncbi:hypothetical protein ACIQUQ_32205 [Streptomyces sp. NPDC101118]|uniref:hypothetical protein n=1 Tax=Streptomyces sp. NPDC101118 TaxID=3366109 RepID=UPI00381EF094
MNRSMLRALPGAVLAGAALTAAFALGAPQAFAAPGGAPAVRGDEPARSQVLGLPRDYVRQGFSGLPAGCEAEGRAGVADGRWSAYLCHRDLPFSAFVNLYVKN